MDKKRKKSGSQFKQQRLMKQEQGKKLSCAMQEFLKRESRKEKSSTSTDTVTQITQNVMVGEVDESLMDVEFQSPSEDAEAQATETLETLKSNEETDENLGTLELPADPGLWNTIPIITSKIRQMLVERGPNQIKECNFPQNEGRRKFSPSHYLRVLNNGEVVERPWLMYSVMKNAIFCFCCILFDNSTSGWPKKGYSDWVNLSRALTMHERSEKHKDAFRAWKELDIRLKQRKTIDAEYQKILDVEIHHWRGVLKRIMSIIRLLASQCLALRGTTEHLFRSDNGNFLKLVELLAEFDPVMEEHIRRIQRQSDKWSVTYLSNNIQDELINLMGNRILEEIVGIANKAKYFSIIADCTPDVSHIEQLSLTVRMVVFNSKDNKYEVEEFFIGFFEASDSTGEGLTELILTHLDKLGFELKWLRGQGYDNGANMKGVRKGVQNRILEKYPRAFYVPCACHSLNLVVNDAASSSTETISFFSLVQELYTFFSSSTKRWAVLKNHIPLLTLKPLSATRWSSRIDALKPLRYQLCEIYDALIEIIENDNWDADTKVKAKGLATNIKNYKFICSVIMWHDILFEINGVSKLLQSATINLSDCVSMLSQTIEKLQNYRQCGYEHMKTAANDIAEDLECDANFQTELEVRSRRKKRQFDYESFDVVLTEDEKFKINFFNYVLDVTLTSLNERFSLLETHNSNFQFLYNIFQLRDTDQETLKNYCMNLQSKLSAENESDLNGTELVEELYDVSRVLHHLP